MQRKTIVSLLSVSIVLIVALFLFKLQRNTSGINQISNHFYVRNAEVDEASSMSEISEGLQKVLGKEGHKFSEGNGIVIGYRAYTDNPEAFGDEFHENITIWIKDGQVSENIELAIGEDIEVFYHLYFPSGNAHTVGEIRDGTIKISYEGTQMTISVKGNIHTIYSELETRGSVSQLINKEFSARRIFFPRVSRWYAR